MSIELFLGVEKEITNLNQIQGGATIFDDGTLGYTIHLRLRNGLSGPIYMTDEDYAQMCHQVAVKKGQIKLQFYPASAKEFPQEGLIGFIKQ